MNMVGPIIPFLAPPPSPPPPTNTNSSVTSSIQYLSWQPTQNPNPNLRKQSLLPMLDSTTTAATTTAIIFPNPIHHMVVPPSTTNTTSTTTCQDCGNQAKKDCVYNRCRTCCKSRRFDCPTHVKSTWVPAARRRERQQLNAALAATNSGPKKPRLAASNSNSHTSTSNNTPRSFDTSSSHQDAGSLPWHVRAPAEFKCVRVTSIDDGEDEYAYQAMVKIGGHVFKGFLYDQGVEDTEDNNIVEEDKYNNSSNISTVPNLSELHLGGGRGGCGGGGRNIVSSSSGTLVGVPPDVYGSDGGGSMMGGGDYRV